MSVKAGHDCWECSGEQFDKGDGLPSRFNERNDMGQLSRLLRNGGVDSNKWLSFWCPGCDEPHTLNVGEGSKPHWSWNGDAERPVFSPSVLVTGMGTCHSFIGCNGAAPGQIIFLGDCTHSLANQTVDLPSWPAPYVPESPTDAAASTSTEDLNVDKPLAIGTPVKQKQPAPMEGTVVDVQFDAAVQGFKYKVEHDDHEGNKSTKWFEANEVEDMTPADAADNTPKE